MNPIKTIKELYETNLGKLLLIMIIVLIIATVGAVYLSLTIPITNPNPIPKGHMNPLGG